MATTHRDVLRRLSTEEKRALMVRSDTRGLIHLGGHLGLIGLCLWGNVTGDGAWRWLAMAGQGIAMAFLFTAMHECSHATAFRSRWLNRVVGSIAGLVLLIAPRWFSIAQATPPAPRSRWRWLMRSSRAGSRTMTSFSWRGSGQA